MSSWDFKRESIANNADSSAGVKAGFQPYFEADNLASKRNVIATPKGWVRRQIKTTDGNVRILDEVLVAAHPADGYDYTSNNHLGNPDIAQLYLSATDSSSVANGSNVSVYVVFNEPVAHSGAAGSIRIAITNTAGGAALTGVAAADNSNTGIINANNTLVFNFTATPVGTYKIEAQTLVNATATATNLVSLNSGSESANLVITGPVSNTLGTFTVV